MNIASNGSWLTTTSERHCFDRELAFAILQFCHHYQYETVYDLGCGDGSYVNFINQRSAFVFALGWDGNPNTRELSVTEDGEHYCNVKHLHEELQFNLSDAVFPPDLVISLEVGEHIPAEYEQVYLDNVVRYALKCVILSWAIPGQTGDGHVNCRSNEWVMQQMVDRGWELDGIETVQMRNDAQLLWFKDTLMIFKPIKQRYYERTSSFCSKSDDRL